MHHAARAAHVVWRSAVTTTGAATRSTSAVCVIFCLQSESQLACRYELLEPDSAVLSSAATDVPSNASMSSTIAELLGSLPTYEVTHIEPEAPPVPMRPGTHASRTGSQPTAARPDSLVNDSRFSSDPSQFPPPARLRLACLTNHHFTIMALLDAVMQRHRLLPLQYRPAPPNFRPIQTSVIVNHGNITFHSPMRSAEVVSSAAAMHTCAGRAGRRGQGGRSRRGQRRNDRRASRADCCCVSDRRPHRS